MFARPTLTPIVKVLLIANFVAFLVQQTADQFMGGNLGQTFGLVPHFFLQEFYFWQIFTYSFLHADVMHLFFNMLMLLFLGTQLEEIWGRKKFLKFYFTCVGVAGVCYLILMLAAGTGMFNPLVGASGGIYGFFVAWGLLFAEREILVFFMFPMKVKQMVWLLIALNFMMGVFSQGQAASAVAHLGGMFAGFIYLVSGAYFRARKSLRPYSKDRRRSPSLSSRWSGWGKGSKDKKSGSHLKLVIDNQDEGTLLDRDSDDDPKTWH